MLEQRRNCLLLPLLCKGREAMKFKEWIELAIDIIMLEVNCGLTVTIKETDWE